MDGLTDKTAVVTGSSGGIGKAIAERFAAEGANVVTNSRARERAEAVAAELRETGGTAIGIEADVAEPDAVDRLVAGAVSEFGQIDIMVNNAGYNVITPATEFSPADWQAVLDVNLSGTFFGSQAAARRMLEQGDGGQIINISSMMGAQGLHQRAAYCASKGGINNLTRVCAVEWGPDGIQVNALAPGFIHSEMTADAMENAGFTEQDVRDRTPLDRWGRLDEMANCAAFLAAGNHYMSGEVLTADGGWSAFAWGAR